jgi:hypothetical protein
MKSFNIVKHVDDLRNNILKLLPDLVFIGMRHDPIPEVEELGQELAELKYTYLKLQQVEKEVGEATNKVLAEMQSLCKHPVVYVSNGDHNGRSEWDRKNLYVCKTCGADGDVIGPVYTANIIDRSTYYAYRHLRL